MSTFYLQVLLQPDFLEELTGLAQLHRETAAAMSEMGLLDDDCGDTAGSGGGTAEGGQDGRSQAGGQGLVDGDDSNDWTEL